VTKKLNVMVNSYIYIYIYIYIYMCGCVCVCVCIERERVIIINRKCNIRRIEIREIMAGLEGNINCKLNISRLNKMFSVQYAVV
jgi:hypothetical protein